MQPRQYQTECFLHVKSQNTIVNMPTGTGKTLVAVLAIDHFRKAGKIIFLVPTRPLVSQQAEYVRSNCCERICVTEIQGAKMDSASESQWKDLVSQNDVLVGTTEVFRRALVDTRFLKLKDFSLLIFDECHNAIGNSPMAGILRDAIHRCPSQDAPRILGLTASFVHGKLEDIEKKRKDLEGLLQARMYSPEVDERPMEFERIMYKQSVFPAMEEAVRAKIQTLLDVAGQYVEHLIESKDIIRKGNHVFAELGVSAFIYFLRECVAPQVQHIIETSAEYQSVRVPQNDLELIPQLRQAMRDAADGLDGQLTDLPFVTDKASKLCKLMDDVRLQQSEKRIIIFCEQTVLAFPLAHLLQQHLKCKVGTCTGVGSMSEGQRKQALESFKSGQVPILTCTAALEEGLDVSECEVVVRFSHFATTKSHIQGSGRARAWNAKVFYFDNDPNRELAGADLVDLIAKTSSLSLTESEKAECRTHKDVDGIHPFHTASGAEISIFNGVQLVYEYTAKTMGQSFRPTENMLSYVEDVICEYPRQVRKTLVSAKIPSPDGFIEVVVNTVNAWWGNVGLGDVAEPSRMKNWDGSDKELRRFMYVVAVDLSRRGYLDAKNQPSARALQETRHACEHWQMAPGIKIKPQYDPDGLRSNGSSQFQAGQGNAKGKLNKLTGGAAKYSTVSEGTGFRSSLSLPDGRTIHGTVVAASKKAAEQHVAELALEGPSQCQLHKHTSSSVSVSTPPASTFQEVARSDIMQEREQNLNDDKDEVHEVTCGPVAHGDQSQHQSQGFSPGMASSCSVSVSTPPASTFQEVARSEVMQESEQNLNDEKDEVHEVTCGPAAHGDQSQHESQGFSPGLASSCSVSVSTPPESTFQEVARSGVMQERDEVHEVTCGPAAHGDQSQCQSRGFSPGLASSSTNELQDAVEPKSVEKSTPNYVNPCAAHTVHNAKGQLNELTGGAAKYITVPDGAGFRSSVVLPDGTTIHGTIRAGTKKAAEQHVADLAFKAVSGANDGNRIASSTMASSSVHQDANHQVPKVEASESTTSAEGESFGHPPSTDNAKGKVNELTNGAATYETIQDGSGFRASVTLPDGKVIKGTMIAATKKAAEQHAAQLALATLQTLNMSSSAKQQRNTQVSNAEVLQANCKGALNELFPGQTIQYSTQAHPSGGFRSCLSLPDGRTFSGNESAPNKKAAEQLAAKAALIAMRSTA